MRIGIDARLMGETGVGRYIRNLIAELAVIDNTDSYVVFVRDANWQPPNERWTRRIVDVPWHSVTEQLVMPWILARERLDLVHIPYFNVPIFYPGSCIVTIHDLTILHFDTGKATTLPFPLYRLRRLGYRIVLSVGLARAKRIIAVSQATKQELIDHFRLDPEKIVVMYEGIDKKLKIQKEKRLIQNPYFLYVGNAYPHKNLETLMQAFGHNTEKLVLVGKDDYFYKKIKNLVHTMKLENKVIFFGQADDEQLANLYHNAIALVFPSLMEGFGLPGLEAMAHGIPVLCSDIPVFHEIYGESAVYFNPKNDADIAAKLKKILTTNELRERLVESGFSRMQRFSWHRLAEQTLNVYTLKAP